MRIRTIKPEFFTHEGLYEAERETQLPVRVAFAGLWCVADREGRFRWQPRRIGVAILPYDECDFSRVLDALTTRGFVRRYKVNGEEFGFIPSFKRHQVINNREKDSDLPEPSLAEDSDAWTTRAARDEHARGTPLGKDQGEGKGREGERNGKEPTPLPGSAAPTEAGGITEGRDAGRIPTTEQSKRVAGIMHRRLTTVWSCNEVKAYKALGTIPEDDLAALERYYASNWPPKHGVNVLRHDLLTLLNNFQGEIDRAYGWAHKKKPNRANEWQPSAPANVVPMDPAEEERIRNAAKDHLGSFRKGVPA